MSTTTDRTGARALHGVCLRAERRRRLLTISQLALLAKVSVNTVAAAERGLAGERSIRSIVCALADVPVPSITKEK